MEIREGDNCVTIEVVERVPSHLPTAGDIELSLKVNSEKFSGQSIVWIGSPDFATFLVQLRQLEAKRQGEAVIEGLSPENIRFRLRAIDRRGHMAVDGMIAKLAHMGNPYRHSMEFGFEFDPTLLPKVLAGFEELAKSPG